jgi:hypothetical protein
VLRKERVKRSVISEKRERNSSISRNKLGLKECLRKERQVGYIQKTSVPTDRAAPFCTPAE